MAAKQAELEAVYTQMVERDPSVYAYPPCIDARVTSAAMIGELMSSANSRIAAPSNAQRTWPSWIIARVYLSKRARYLTGGDFLL